MRFHSNSCARARCTQRPPAGTKTLEESLQLPKLLGKAARERHDAARASTLEQSTPAGPASRFSAGVMSSDSSEDEGITFWA
jgi:hypothetical protein